MGNDLGDYFVQMGTAKEGFAIHLLEFPKNLNLFLWIPSERLILREFSLI